MTTESAMLPSRLESKCLPYLEYKDSGIPWLGPIPWHWGQKPLKRIFQVFNGATPRSTQDSYWDGDIPWVTPEDLGLLNGCIIKTTARQITQAGYESCGTQMVPAGSLVLSTRAPIGHLSIAGVALCTNQGCRSLLLTQKGDIRYFFYELLAARRELQSWGQGSTFMELASAKLGAVQIAQPPLEEQQAVVGFLDRETGKIDALIAKREQLIALLEEKRAALISHAVTKGIESNVPMKDSGVPWLGRVPNRWDIVRLRAFLELQRGYDLPENRREDGTVPVISSSGPSAFHSKAMVKGPGVVTGRYGTIGEVFFIEEDFWPLNTSLYVRDFKGNDPSFARYLLMILPFGMFSDKSAVPGVNRNHLHTFAVARPPHDEQCGIAAYLDSATKGFDNLIGKVKEGIELLLDYRLALISAAVTGKIDVRGEMQ